MTAWLRGLLSGDAEVIAQESARCSHGRIHLLDVLDGEATELVVEPAGDDHATRRAQAMAELRGLKRPQGGQR